MTSQTVMIPGIAVPLRVEPSFLRGFKLYAGEQRVKVAFWRGRLELPGADGSPVQGRMQAQVWQTYPRLVLGEKTYLTGPEAPTALRVVACLPLLLLVVALGALPALIVLVGVFVNMNILREGHRGLVAVASMVGVTIATGIVLTLVLTALGVAIYGLPDS